MTVQQTLSVLTLLGPTNVNAKPVSKATEGTAVM